MPYLINILHNANNKEYRLLRGKTMECASLIALAVGKEIFSKNAIEFINILSQTQGIYIDNMILKEYKYVYNQIINF